MSHRVALITATFWLLLRGSVLAQGSGVAGSVVDAGSLRPIEDVLITIVESGRETRTDARGRFAFNDLTGTNVTLTLRRVGYRLLIDTVTVGDLAVRLRLRESAVSLDAVVVTGTPGGTEARAVGNAVATIDAATVLEVAPIGDVQALFTARVPGLTILPTQGNVGTGGLTQLRGVSSLSLSNEPLVYVDGVRLDNNARAGPNIRDGRQVARINDLNPEDIERVEIIKGPSAATLYGTDASRGVIQILTHHGRVGAPRVAFTVKQGTNWFMNPAGRLPWVFSPDSSAPKDSLRRFPGDTAYRYPLDSVNLYAQEQAAGRPIFQNGDVKTYGLRMSGGSEAVRYFLSGGYDGATGVVPYNWRRNITTRANLSLVPSAKVSVTTSTAFVHNTARFAQAFDLYGVMDQMVWGSPSKLDGPTRGFLRATPEAVAMIDARSGIDRLIGGVQIRHQPWSWLHQRVNFGADLGDETSSILFPRDPAGDQGPFGGSSLGDKAVDRRRVRYTTFDYGLSAAFAFSNPLRSTTSLGAQYYFKDITTAGVTCEGFADPTLDLCGGATQTTGSDGRLQNKTEGVYAQQQFGWKNRVFLTGALRADDNSAFGRNFDYVLYPKVAATWVASEEPFWKSVPWMNALKLRGAWGAAGQQPDAYAAIRSYQAAPGTGTLTPLNVGNPDLKPERATEVELGGDAGLFNDRVAIAFTYYQKETRDAIIARQEPPSLGFPGTQLVNLSAVRNWGTELAVDARLLNHRVLAWDLGLIFATSDSRVESLGGLPALDINSRDQQEHEGYPVASFFQRVIVSAELDANRKLVNVLCAGGPGNAPVPCNTAPRVYTGQPTPRWQGSIRSTVTLLRNLRLYALVDFKGGYQAYMGDIVSGIVNADIRNNRALYDSSNVLLLAFDALGSGIGNRQVPGFINAGFARLRELSATYTMPLAWAVRFGASSGTITVGGRNLAFLWRAQKESFGVKVMDPEVHRGDIAPELSGFTLVPFPQYAQVIVTARLSY